MISKIFMMRSRPPSLGLDDLYVLEADGGQFCGRRSALELALKMAVLQ